MKYFKSISCATIALASSVWLACATPALAGPYVHNGATFQVVASNINGSTADFTYTADFTDPGWISSGGTNALDYIIAIDFKLSGYSVASIDSFDVNDVTNSAAPTAVSGWLPLTGNSNANGCSTSNNATFACAQESPFLESNATLTAGILQWDFRVTFNEELVATDFLQVDNHIGAFFRRCSDKNNGRQCKKGLGLSETVSFGPGPDPDPDPDPMPVPGTVALFGLGALGLGISRRRRKTN
jgi:hypothetical protein